MDKGKKIAIGLVVGVPLFCLLGSYAIFQKSFGAEASKLSSELTAARKDGMPVTAEELSARLKVPDSENAAAEYEALFRPITLKGPLEKDSLAVIHGFGSLVKAEDKLAGRQALPHLQEVLRQARKVASKPHCLFAWDWSKGSDLMMPEFAEMKGVAKLLCFDAEALGDQGDWKGALANIEATQRIGRHAAEEPLEIGLLVGIAIEAIAEATLNRLTDKFSHNAPFLSEAKRIVDAFGPIPEYRRTLGGHLVMLREALRQANSLTDLTGDGGDLPSTDSPPEPRKPSAVEKTLFNNPSVKNAFDSKITRAARLLYEQVPKNSERWEAIETVSKANGKMVEDDISPANTVARLLWDPGSGMGESIARCIMRRNLTDTSLRLLLDRVRLGKLPGSLPSYGSSDMDPFSGKPLVYHPSKTGFLLYSFGVDRKDDGGISRHEASLKGISGSDETLEIH